MASIHQLSAKTVHSLSMGQVVTSVFSVVKELLENALDAGATAVDVRLDDFGLEKIEVRDNGSGLTPEDTAVMGQVHYTSKIQHLDDMGSLASFGFRGEALSAVCASCEVTVATRTASEQAGRLVTLDARGAVTAQRPVARAQGTTVTASSLFSRHPVRRQMYSSARKRKDDLRAVEALLTATAVSQPALRLTLHHNGCQLINKAPCDSITSAALQVLKSDAARLLKPLTLSDPPISVEALLPAPDASPKLTGRSTGDQCFIIVNGRVVSHKKVEKLLRDQFSSRHGLSPPKTPVCVLRITVPPQQLDVNLEPNKTRLLLLCEEKLLSMLEKGLSEFYRSPEVLDPEPANGVLAPSEQPTGAAAPSFAGSVTEASLLAPSDTADVAAPVSSAAPISSAAKTGTVPVVMAHEDFSPPPGVGVTRDQTNLLGPVSTVTDVLDSTSKSATDALRLNGHVADFVTEVRLTNDSATEVHLSDDPVTNAPDAPRLTSVTAETSGVPELTDIEWDASGESLFGDNFLGVPDDSGEQTPPAGEGAASRTGGTGPRPANGVRPADPWATGRLLDSQGELIEPTKLVTSHGKLGAKPKIQPSILKAFGGSAVRPPPTANSASNPSSNVPGSTNANGATSVTNGSVGVGGGGVGGVAGGDRGEGCPAPAPKPVGPPPAKRPRPTGPGEPEYEPVASQVVRRAGTAFHYYCKDMRRKYLSLDPTMDIGKLSAALADGWKAALPSVKRQFEDMAREDERRYKEDVRKAKLAELIRTPQRTITDFCRVDTELRRMVAPLTPETAPTPPTPPAAGAAAAAGKVDKKSRPARRVQRMSLRGLREQVRRVEAGEPLDGCEESADPRVIGPLESHYAWVVLRSSQLLLVNPLRLSEVTTLSRLLATYRFPCQPLSPPLPLTSAALGDSAHSTLCALPRDGSRVADVRIEANGFCVEVSCGGESARLVAATDCMEFYGAGDLAEVLRKIAAGAQTLEESRPARVVSWLRAEAVRVSQGGGARMSREEVESLVHDAGDLDAECFHGRPLAAPLYDLAT